MLKKNRTTLQRLRRWSRYQYLRVMRMNATPYSVAMGLAVGIFAGFLPIVPLQTALTVALCLPLRGNPVVGFMGTWISNPFNWVPFYYFLFIVGRALVPWDVPPLELDQFGAMLRSFDVTEFMSFGKDLLASFQVMLIAGCAMGLPSAVVTFYVTRVAVIRYRRRRALRLLRKRTRLS
ncbi:DUF2062 domain-containing protein [Desulfocurvus sp.]|jgi:hypothetical protein|uniref:DUF2062 domain-containing protein n=1 Tax=Desulfocurvus sp. TaxID=2871698 RepID=UPI0025BB2498|nr:DUF2062 domain-containing protein [Desulfocurvus sp.]MCK9239253.1 DUF2062 domain-containing protein [Desulfocurvus sp.]